ncbi:hypothetical protein Dda_4089 [Drechslerella dactyloides]|uniref:Protein kinase domain-containing protein n=1 Tax=Drechslerella dactyloides TaxID=74499 RepID=A0AAD6IZ38_DREDA|nr:hypothetical protein Dda_4089 [Drechslerella dactyloides]
MKLKEYLDTIEPPDLEPIEEGFKPAKEPSGPSNPRELPTNLVPWDGFEAKVRDLLTPHLNREYPEFDNMLSYASDVRGYNQPDSQPHIVALAQWAYEYPVCRILDIVFGIPCLFLHHRVSYEIGYPDHVFVRYKPAEQPLGCNDTFKHIPQKACLVAEYKTPWALDLPDDLAKAYNVNNGNNDDNIVKAIHQLYGYMSWNDVNVGILSTYTSTFCFQRDEDFRLRVSRKFKNSERGWDSVIPALIFVCHVAITEGYHSSSAATGDPRGTQVMSFDPQSEMLYEGTWDSGLKVPWKDMEIVLDRCLLYNYATVMTADLRHRDHQNKANKKFNKSVVCKIYDLTSPESAEWAQNELQMYIRLKPLQGKHIPILFAAGTYWGMLMILVLQHCGEAVPEKPPRGFWKQAREAVEALHSNGILHRDIDLQNFTIRNGDSKKEVRLIGLAESRALGKRAIAKRCHEDLEALEGLEKEIEKYDKDQDDG